MLEYLTRLDEQERIEEAKAEGLEMGKEIGKTIGIELGKELGEENGIRKANIAAAKRLRAIGMTDMQIHEITGLSFEDIENL